MATKRRSRLGLPFDGTRARDARERRGLTLAELSDRTEKAGLRVGISTLHRWEVGDFVPRVPRLRILVVALNTDKKDGRLRNISIDDLLTPADEIRRESA